VPRTQRLHKPIPSVSSPKVNFEANDYSLGYNSFVSNDKFPMANGGTNMWRLAQDARITTLGEYETRKGFDFHADAAGVTQDQTITSTTGAADKSFDTVTRLAQKFTAGTSGRLTKVELNLKNSASATGIIMVCIYADSAGSPGALLATSSIAASSLTSSYAYITARFAEAPVVTATTVYWIVAYVQATGAGSYKWSGTTSATTAKTSTDSGSTWSSTSYALNFKQHYATSGGTKGLHRAYKSDGTKVTLIAHGTALYKADDVTGALTAIKTGLSPNATDYRFVTVADTVYYVNGFDGYRKWDFTTESQVSITNYTDICNHKGLNFLVRQDDPARIDFTNFADYETFTSTDFIYVPAPKTGDPIASFHSLNGYLLMRTRNRCFILSGDDNATFRVDEAPDQKGTYTAETSVFDKSYNYFLSDDGVYRSNGTQPQMISENIHNDILRMANKDDACMAVSRGRLYLWFTSDGASANDSCYVWNLNYSGKSDTVESFDTKAYVCRATSGFQDNDDLLVASSLVGQVMWQEKDSNDYCNLGGELQFELRTHYFTFDRPAVTKQIRYWEPRFGTQDGNYTMKCEYTYDLRDNWTTHTYINVQAAGYTWGSANAVWGAFTWGSSQETQATQYVPGEYRRIAIRYKHTGARQPQKFLGHTLSAQLRRMR
jgi:hypothetical protein